MKISVRRLLLSLAAALAANSPSRPRRAPPPLSGRPKTRAILLHTGDQDPAAHAFRAFLKGPTAKAIIRRYGYRRFDAPASELTGKTAMVWWGMPE